MEVDHRIIKWKIFGYVIGCIGIGINLAYLDGFGRKIVDQWEFILIGEFYDGMRMSTVLIQKYCIHLNESTNLQSLNQRIFIQFQL